MTPAPEAQETADEVARAVELLQSEMAGYRVAAEIERGVMWSLAPYVERFHANDQDPRVTRMVRENSSSRSNEQRMTKLADATETLLAALSSQAEVMEAMAGALSDLVAVVRGECPSLLNEDSGGNSGLDEQVDTALSQYRTLGDRHD